MEWIELIVHTTTEGSDRVSGILTDYGASGTMIQDRADIPDPGKPHGIWEIIDSSLLDNMPQDVLVHAWYQADSSFPSVLESIRNRLEELPKSDAETILFGTLKIDTVTVDDQSWTGIWKKYFKPFHSSEHVVIKPTWEPYTPDENDIVIEIDPGMAFGSGTHETTGMCISLLEETIHGGERIIDVGTGSGILAIAAALLGAGHVLAVDIDPDAVRVASENVAHNHVDAVVTVQEGDLLKQVEETCDICVANIISDIIISFAAPLMSHIVPGGLFLCSGIVKERTEEVRAALLSAGYEILKTEHRGEWTAFLSRRNA